MNHDNLFSLRNSLRDLVTHDVTSKIRCPHVRALILEQFDQILSDDELTAIRAEAADPDGHTLGGALTMRLFHALRLAWVMLGKTLDKPVTPPDAAPLPPQSLH
jgi:hypothetical protein